MYVLVNTSGLPTFQSKRSILLLQMKSIIRIQVESSFMKEREALKA
jgi:hypothetical protein